MNKINAVGQLYKEGVEVQDDVIVTSDTGHFFTLGSKVRVLEIVGDRYASYIAYRCISHVDFDLHGDPMCQTLWADDFEKVAE